MPADFDDRWNEAMARYKAALADCAKIAEETTEAILAITLSCSVRKRAA
jgi:hypothetical protein